MKNRLLIFLSAIAATFSLMCSAGNTRVLENPVNAEEIMDETKITETDVDFTPTVVNIKINGAPLASTYAAVLWEDTTTIIPLRAVTEALGCKVEWIEETETVILIKDDDEIAFKIGSKELTVNGKIKEMPYPAMLVGEITYVPIRAISEALGATVGWEHDNTTAGIDTIGKTNAMRIANYEVVIGSTVSELTSICGEPSYKTYAENGLYWYVYTKYPAAFMAVATDGGIVCGYYTNSKLFVNSDGHRYGDAIPKNSDEIGVIDGEHCKIYEYYDTVDNTLCAVYHIRDGYSNYIDKNESLKNQSRIGLDILNSFRYSKNLSALYWDEYAAVCSTDHSAYMSNLGELTHTGIDGSSAIQRYLKYNPQFQWRAWGENICAEADNIFTCMNGWINSSYHRSIMLSDKTLAGIGIYFNPYGKYTYCATMLLLK